MVPLSFAGNDFVALSSGALWLPANFALFVADLHLEKASFFAGHGQMLPPFDSHETLTRLECDITLTGVETVFCLGDSFHDSAGSERLPDDTRLLLTQLTAATRWVWITGNHDDEIRDRCGGHIMEEAEIADMVLRHEADIDELRPELSGHFHPKLRIQSCGRHVSRRCFVASETKLILPAYGAFTGGLDAAHPEIVKKVGPDAEALVPVSDKLLRFPIAA